MHKGHNLRSRPMKYRGCFVFFSLKSLLNNGLSAILLSYPTGCAQYWTARFPFSLPKCLFSFSSSVTTDKPQSRSQCTSTKHMTLKQNEQRMQQQCFRIQLWEKTDSHFFVLKIVLEKKNLPKENLSFVAEKIKLCTIFFCLSYDNMGICSKKK